MVRFVLIIAIILKGISSAYACSCTKVTPFDEAVVNAETVALATLIDYQHKPQADYIFDKVEGQFQLSKVFKGKSSQSIKLKTAPHSGICGVEMAKGRTYLLVLYDNQAQIQLCGNSRLLRANDVEKVSAYIGNLLAKSAKSTSNIDK